MVSTDRESGIDIVGDVPWGTHLCQFYFFKYFIFGSLSNKKS